MAAIKSTKELARKLGLLRKRSCSSQQSRDVRKASKTRQIFSYLVVIDFESTCWKDKKNINQEVIEFPAVLLNTSTGEVESEFHTYVLPEENPILSDFCTEFTGITQAQVESGAPLSVCLSQFSRWLRKQEAEKGIAYNSTQDASKKLCTFVTWSDWDLGVCLHYECKRKQLVKPPALMSWIDLRATYKNFYQRKPQGLHGALQDVGIEFHGRQHSGLDDSRNTAKLAWRMICDGCVMKITRTMQRNVQRRPPPPKAIRPPNTESTKPAQTHVTSQAMQYDPQERGRKSALGHTANNIIISAPVCNVASGESQSMVWTTTSTISDAVQSEDIYIAPPTPQCDEENVEDRYCDAADDDNNEVDHDDDNDDYFVSATQAIAWQDKWGDTEPSDECKSSNTATPQSLLSIKTSLGANVVNSSTGGQAGSRVDLKRLSSAGNQRDMMSHPSDAKKAAYSTQSKQSPILWTSYPIKMKASTNKNSSEFKTPLAPGSRNSPFSSNGSLKTPPNSVRTPNTNVAPPMLQGKITPPMCGCGRRAKKNNVVSPGPNQGRGFYSCPNRKGGRSSESVFGDSTNRKKSKQGCGYFKWESVVIKERLTVSTTPVLNYKQTTLSSKSPLTLNYSKCTPTTPLMGYKPGYKATPNTVGRLGQSYIGGGSVKLGTGGGGKSVGFGKRLGMSPRRVLKPPTLS